MSAVEPSMKNLVIALLFAVAAFPLAASKMKHKEKHFDPVTISNPADAAGATSASIPTLSSS